jgi:hypothetical protein
MRALMLVGLLSAGVANADTTRLDGNLWLQLPPLAKTEYLVGYTAGLNDATTVCAEAVKGLMPKLDGEALKKLQHDSCTNPTMFSKGTMAQIADGMDALYKDFRNRLILVEHARGIVIMTINGESAVVIDNLTALVRKADAAPQ